VYRGGHEESGGLRPEGGVAGDPHHVAGGDDAGEALLAGGELLAQRERLLVGAGEDPGRETRGGEGGGHDVGGVAHVGDEDGGLAPARGSPFRGRRALRRR